MPDKATPDHLAELQRLAAGGLEERPFVLAVSEPETGRMQVYASDGDRPVALGVLWQVLLRWGAEHGLGTPLAQAPPPASSFAARTLATLCFDLLGGPAARAEFERAWNAANIAERGDDLPGEGGKLRGD